MREDSVFKRIRQNRRVRRIIYSLEHPGSRGRLCLDLAEVEAARVSNRSFLKTVPSWIEEADYQASIFQYGLPPDVRGFIDMPMTEQVTYSDVIGSMAKRLGPKLRYLELGVSVGKNFSQILHHVHDAELTCFDIEDINPVLNGMLQFEDKIEWPTSPTSMRKSPSTLTKFRFQPNNNSAFYLAGDVFDENGWERLRGRTYNLVFSDAFHSAPALLKEWEMFNKYRLLAPEGYTVLWDDLGDRDMRKAFYQIVDQVRTDSRFAIEAGIEFYRGWLGELVTHHPIGFIKATPRK